MTYYQSRDPHFGRLVLATPLRRTIFFNTSGNKPDTSFPTVMLAITRLIASALRSRYSELSSARSSKFSPMRRNATHNSKRQSRRKGQGGANITDLPLRGGALPFILLYECCFRYSCTKLDDSASLLFWVPWLSVRLRSGGHLAGR